MHKQSMHGHEGWNLPSNAAQTKNPVEATSESIAQGKRLYSANCAMCHGQTGKGDGPVAASLKPKPMDLTDKKFMAQHTDGEFYWMITKGKAPMPGYGKTLSEKDRWHIVNYIRTLTE